MKIYDIVDYRAYATSDLRAASNGKEITQRFAKITGIRGEITDSQEEAYTVS